MENTTKKTRRRGIYLVPNMLTLAALFCGFFAIVAATNGWFDWAAYAIFTAMIFDGADGRVARWTNTQSDFGAEFDSLADMVSFGVAPALIIFEYALGDNPMGPFKVTGIIMDQNLNCWTNHHSIIKYNGQWYDT